MFSLFRLILFALLCITVSAGPIPAWMHVVSCHGHATVAQAECGSGESTLHGGHSHCHAAGLLHECAAATTEDGEEPSNNPGRDSEHCAICQSLLLPGGLIYQSSAASLSEALCFIILPEYPHFAGCERFGISSPRGPPGCIGSIHS